MQEEWMGDMEEEWRARYGRGMVERYGRGMEGVIWKRNGGGDIKEARRG